MRLYWIACAAVLIGCSGDGLAGKWEGAEDDAVDLDVREIDSGFEGEGHIYLCSETECFLCPFDFEATEKGDDEYDIEGEFKGNCSDAGAFEDVTCRLVSDSRLECQTPDGLDIEYDKVE